MLSLTRKREVVVVVIANVVSILDVLLSTVVDDDEDEQFTVQLLSTTVVNVAPVPYWTLRYCCGVPAYNGPVNELSVLFNVTVKLLGVEVYIDPSRR